MQNKREELSTFLNIVRSLCLKNGRDVRSRSKALSSNSCNCRRSIRMKKLRQKQQLLISFRLIRMPLSIMLKQPLLIRLDQILLATSKICRACNLPRKKRRLILAVQTWLWLKNLMKKTPSSKTLQDSWRDPNGTEANLPIDSLIWT